jgi:hypothetical protein
VKAATAWSLGQIGHHTPEHAKAVAVANVLPKLLHCYLKSDASEDLQTKVSVLSRSRSINWSENPLNLFAFETVLSGVSDFWGSSPN